MVSMKTNQKILGNSSESIFFRLDVAEFLKAVSECWPFEIAVEFLSESEKKGIFLLIIFYFRNKFNF